jgi:hypothetical protein
MALIFTKQSSKQKWKWYENKEWGFRVKYPADWKAEETENFLFASAIFRKDLCLRCLFVAGDTHPELSPYELAMKNLEELKKKVSRL